MVQECLLQVNITLISTTEARQALLSVAAVIPVQLHIQRNN